jgi:hypothetical protein
MPVLSAQDASYNLTVTTSGHVAVVMIESCYSDLAPATPSYTATTVPPVVPTS